MTRRRVDQLRAVSVLLLLLMLSNIAAWEHVLPIPGASHEGDAEEHAAHCHYGPAACGNEPADPQQALNIDNLLPQPLFASTHVPPSESTLQAFSLLPTTPPPRA